MNIYTASNVSVEEEAGVRGLFINGECQGRAKVDLGGIELVSPYLIALEQQSANLKPARALVVGAGACLFPTILNNKGWTVDVVDPVEHMFVIAYEHFKYKRTGIHYTISGEDYLSEYKNRYDIILLDAFEGFETIHGLYSRASAEKFKHRLNKNGQFYVNFVSRNPHDVDLQEMIISSVFNKIDKMVISTKDLHQTVFIGYNE